MKTVETLKVTDMDCADCALNLERAIGQLPGVASARVDFVGGTLRLEYEPERAARGDVVGLVQAMGYGVAEPAAPGGELTSEFRLSGLDCADCARSVERNLAALEGVVEARVSFATAALTVVHRPRVRPEEIIRVVEASGYGATPLRAQAPAREQPFFVRNRRAALTVAAGVALLGGLASQSLGAPAILGVVPLPVALYAASIALGGYHVARSGLYSLLKARTPDMNALMAIAIVGAVAIGEWLEGATVVCLFALGTALESYTMDRARAAVRALLDVAPDTARVRRGGVEAAVPAEQVRVGEVVVVRPGEKVPVDGVVLAGGSGVNQAPITGESLPVEKAPGDEVFAGSIVERGYLEVEARRPYEENTISRIARLVEQAQAERAPAERFVDRFARYYTPAVIAGAVAVALLPWLALDQPFLDWFGRALVLLVIACPCALVISTPVSIVSALARAAGLGVLVKGGAYVEELAAIRVVALDKTGTLTIGRPEVTDVVPLDSLPAEEVLHLTAALESRSEHPLAAAILRRAHGPGAGGPGHGAAGGANGHNHAHGGAGATPVEAGGAAPVGTHDHRHGSHERGPGGDEADHTHAVVGFEAVVGKGVRATLDGRAYYVGSPRLFQDLGTPLNGVSERVRALQGEGKTVLLTGTEREVVGLIAVADQLRPGAKAAIAALRRAGVERVVLLTGDHEATARAIARAVGADDYRAELLPEGKVAAVRDLRSRYGKVAMVGDGVNDAPALAAATVGIAMGVTGTDAALEAADVALMADDLAKVAVAIGLSRRALGAVRQNVALSLVVKAAFLALALPGLATLWMAIAADMGTSLVVTLNGMRLLRYRERPAAGAAPHEHRA